MKKKKLNAAKNMTKHWTRRKTAIERQTALEEIRDKRINEILENIESKPKSKSNKKKKLKKQHQNIASAPISRVKKEINATHKKTIHDKHGALMTSIADKLP